MKTFARVAALAAVTILSAGAAAAATLDSSSATVFYTGYSATTGTLTNNAPAATFNIGTGGAWAAPIGGSSWVSYNPNTAPGGSVQPANGTYTYTAVFNSSATTATLTVLADDTTSVYLNGVQVVAAAAPVPATKCTVGTPNCSTIATYNLTGLTVGNNNLTFGVNQLFNSATGLDFEVSNVPEPSSLMLLGTGLVGSAGMFFRRLRA